MLKPILTGNANIPGNTSFVLERAQPMISMTAPGVVSLVTLECWLYNQPVTKLHKYLSEPNGYLCRIISKLSIYIIIRQKMIDYVFKVTTILTVSEHPTNNNQYCHTDLCFSYNKWVQLKLLL